MKYVCYMIMAVLAWGMLKDMSPNQQIASCSNSNRGFFCLGGTCSCPISKRQTLLFEFWVTLRVQLFIRYRRCRFCQPLCAVLLQHVCKNMQNHGYMFDIISWWSNTRISVHECLSFMKTDHECLISVGSGQGGYTSSECGRGRRMVTGPPFNKCLECSFEAVFF